MSSEQDPSNVQEEKSNRTSTFIEPIPEDVNHPAAVVSAVGSNVESTEVEHRQRFGSTTSGTQKPALSKRQRTTSEAGSEVGKVRPALRSKMDSNTSDAAAEKRHRTAVSFMGSDRGGVVEGDGETANIRQHRTTTTSSIAESIGRAGRAMSLSVRLRRPGSVMTEAQVHKVRCQGFLDCCLGSLQTCGKDSSAEMDELKNESNMDFHKLSVRQLCSRLATDTTYGLSDIDVQQRLQQFGLNSIRPPPALPEWFKFCKQLAGGFSIMLWIGSILCFIAYGLQFQLSDDVPGDNLYLGCVLAAVVLITGIFSYYQEAKSSKIMESFQNFMPSFAVVIRLGQETQVPVEELVPGDIVNIRGGDKIPADCRVVKASNFKVDNSCLTGESEPQARSPECTSDNPLETKNLIFFSTFAVEGTATAVVVTTGDHTVMGRIARLTTGIKQKKTPLARELELFVYVICIFASIIGAVFLIIILVRDPSNWIGAVVFVIGIIIGNVPEGVLIEVALCLTLAAKRMAKRKALVKNLEAVETLGSTSTICSDKTGTLTQNKMTVAHMWFNNEIHVADITKEQIVASKYQKDGESSGWNALIRVATLCSRAVFKPNQEQVDVMERECIGDGSESGLLKFAERSIGSVEQYRQKWPKAAEIPFSSVTKYQISVHKRLDTGRYIVVMKGAPERVIDMCSTMWLGEANGGEVAITDEVKENFNNVYASLGGLGERVLGFAEMALPHDQYPPNYRFETDPEPNFPLKGLRFVGLIAMMDPPRPSVPEAVRKCRDAGIRVVMVTGDHPLTAKAIAKMVGIFSPSAKTVEDIAKERRIKESDVNPKEANAIVVAGGQLKDMTNEQLDDIIANYNEIVFARTSPQQKLLIVEGFQRSGSIVAVTGDGVNDSPALKQADIGIAMGITGSDVSKQAADMILMDDNFATIVFAIEEGRLLFDNLKKTVCYILVANPPEIAAALSYVVLSIPLPMGTIAMLVICLVTDMVPAVMLAYEDAESDIMKRKPRNSKTDTLITSRMMSVSYGQNAMIETAAAFFAYFVCLAESGFLAKDCFGISGDWDSMGNNNVVDSYGQEWSYNQRKQLEHTLYSVYFLAMVEMQWVNVICCKARRCSLYGQSWTNNYLYLGIIFETGIAVLLCYCPGVNDAFFMAPIYGLWWLPALPFGLLLLAWDQIRKSWIRNRGGSGSFSESEFYY